ncbi:unnamed protein product [Arctia plantaginis]|uniref:Uncharacterized protein n=1 Tax=Arctia plantaginis TaxID=874455 RepID=A0A8S0ZBM0_ARCPL|nr:unnamed protein product [Arctia plantaginis]CAB3252995.1 unnamed protein product [Arctia plantaginis]
MPQTDAYTDVVELCALLQCLGFSVKSLDTSDGNVSHDAGLRTVVINCQSSGLHVVLENPSLSCSCPTSGHQQNSGIWQVSGVTGGKQLDKEFGCTLLGSLPKSHRDRLTKELHDIIRCIKQHNESDVDTPKDALANKSASMIELKTPDKITTNIKAETPTRYRSLDTLIAPIKKSEQPFPTPGILQRANLIDASADNGTDNKKQMMCSRQSTYTLSSTPGSVRRRNKTSSPIKSSSQRFILDSLIAAEKVAEDLHSKLTLIIREIMEEDNHNSSISSLALDVSKISVLKVVEPIKSQFASSPNLSAIGHVKEDLVKSSLKRFESASTSNLAPCKSSTKESSISKLRRMSPNFFKSKETSGVKTEKGKSQDTRSKFQSLLKPKIVTPVRTARMTAESSPNLSSSSKKKFSHVKSTIPRPMKKE